MTRAKAARFRDVVERAGGLVGANRAAAILGVAPPNLRRYRDRLTAIRVEGSSDVFAKSEVEALGRELREAREAK